MKGLFNAFFQPIKNVVIALIQYDSSHGYQFKVQMCLDLKPIELDTKLNKNFASKECLYEASLQSFSCFLVTACHTRHNKVTKV